MRLSYRKSRHLKQQNFIHIYSNGKSEINYFIEKKSDCLTKRNIKIESFFENAGNPAYFLKNIAKKYKLNELTDKDKIFCVIDVDEITNNDIQEGLRIKAEFIDLIVSNPNFELWLLLHFKLYTHRFSIDETLIKLKSFLPEYEKPKIKPVYPKLRDNEHNAISNAKKLRRYHVRDRVELFSCNANPHTTIDTIIELINSF